jgi:hypothetical protein
MHFSLEIRIFSDTLSIFERYLSIFRADARFLQLGITQLARIFKKVLENTFFANGVRETSRVSD